MTKSTVLDLLERISAAVVFCDRETPAGYAGTAEDLTWLAGRLAAEGHAQKAATATLDGGAPAMAGLHVIDAPEGTEAVLAACEQAVR